MNLDSTVYFTKRGLWLYQVSDWKHLSKFEENVILGKIPSGDLHKVVKGRGMDVMQGKITSHVTSVLKSTSEIHRHLTKG